PAPYRQGGRHRDARLPAVDGGVRALRSVLLARAQCRPVRVPYAVRPGQRVRLRLRAVALVAARRRRAEVPRRPTCPCTAPLIPATLDARAAAIRPADRPDERRLRVLAREVGAALPGRRVRGPLAPERPPRRVARHRAG